MALTGIEPVTIADTNATQFIERSEEWAKVQESREAFAVRFEDASSEEGLSAFVSEVSLLFGLDQGRPYASFPHFELDGSEAQLKFAKDYREAMELTNEVIKAACQEMLGCLNLRTDVQTKMAGMKR